VKLRHKLVGVTLLSAAFGSSALSLGRARGAVVLGQPLSLAVEVRVDSLDEATAQCFRAEVIHGDSAVDAARVRLIVQPPAVDAQDAVIRIRSSAIVDEPVVGVVLHALCGQRGMRRYDFLPEYPAELVAAQVPMVIAGSASAVAPSTSPQASPAAASSVPPPAATALPTPAAIGPMARAATPARAPVRRTVTPRPVAAVPGPASIKPERTVSPRLVEKPVASTSNRPRLQLDAPLRSSPALPGPPTENLAERAEAGATWRALNAGPNDMLDNQRLQALEEQAKGVKLQAEKAERDLRERLERAERRLDEAANNRVDIALLYGLLALLLLTTAAAAYFWRRARRAALESVSWVGSPGGMNDGLTGATTLAPTAPVFGAGHKDPSTPAALAPNKRATVTGHGAVAAVVGTRSMAGEAVVTSAAAPVKVQSRTVDPEEFFDVQQHADFFMSLGQYDQAIEVLKKHIDEHAEMSPLAFLELFKIYHTLGRQGEFNALRDEFQRVFNGRIPNFAAFTDEGLGLEDYPATLLSIESTWGSPRVLDTIEANVFRHPEDTGRPLDLAAFRDLLLLHTVASSLQRPGAGAAVGADVVGRSSWSGGLEEDAAFSPRRLTRPDFTASLTPNLSSAASTLAPASFTTPAEMVASVAPVAQEDSGPAALSSPNYDHGLMLDLDLSAPLDAPVTAPSRVDPQELPDIPPLPKLDLDLDLGFDLDLEPGDGDGGPDTEPMPHGESAQPATSTPEPGPVLDSGLIDFDLFDPSTEARIAPKVKR
jgi:pilus assembly protein FimV